MHRQQGFTLIELITSMTIIAMLSSIGIASFVTFSRTQAVSGATQDVVTMLEFAKASAASQVKPITCTPGPLTGYRVTIEPANNAYYMQPLCNNNPDLAAQTVKILPKKVLFPPSEISTFTFYTISGNVVIIPSSASITLMHEDDSKVAKTISVASDGRIHVQ